MGESISLSLDQLWVLVAAALVFFMQAGFKALEAGLVRKKHSDGIGVKNLLDWIVGGIFFFSVGFALMFGKSAYGFIGTTFFWGEGLAHVEHKIGGALFLLFQLGFAGTALTIISGAMSGRTGLIPYLISSICVAVFIYPVVGHWVWGKLLIDGNPALLADWGFLDFAGSSVVHSTGAWVSIVGIWIVGPRVGRFDTSGGVRELKASNYAYSILGVMILWLGWFGFNGGSELALNGKVVDIILNTNFAASAGGLSAFLHCVIFQKRNALIEKLIGGALAGLVAITASCNIVSITDSFLIGFFAGIIHNIGYDFLLYRLRLDDPVGAIAVHGFGGAWGTIAVALFGDAATFSGGRLHQLGVQLAGVLVILVFTLVTSLVMFWVIKRLIGLRVSPRDELHGQFIGKNEEEHISTSHKFIERFRQQENQQLAFVSLMVSNSGHNMLSKSEFMEIPAEKRNALIQEDKVEFISDKGNLMPTLDALSQLNDFVEGIKNEIIEERDQFAEKDLRTQQGLTYARGVQKSVMPTAEYLTKLFDEHFVFSRPKDIVSGDFLWAKQRGDKVYFALADCTGHGVSAAFVSIMGLSFLNEIVEEKENIDADEVLNQLREKVKKALQQSGESKYKEGMDIALCVLNRKNFELQYAGAYNPLYIVRDGEVIELKGDRMPVGVFVKDYVPFRKKSFQLHKNDTLYLSSDGFIDQLNTTSETKFLRKRYKSLLTDIAHLPMREQRQKMKQTFLAWKGETEQVDDVLIWGIRIATASPLPNKQLLNVENQ